MTLFILNPNTLRQIPGFENLSDFDIAECNRRALADIELSIRMFGAKADYVRRGYKLAEIPWRDEMTGSAMTLTDWVGQ